MKYVNGSEMTDIAVFEKRILASHDEVLHNVITVDEDGKEISFEHSRRADDHTMIDEECVGLRDPHRSCLGMRLRAIKSPYNPSCWDHNQTVDATLRCYASNGRRRANCMQLSYSQNAYFTICGGEYSDSSQCGTYIEIHRENGSPYDDEGNMLAESKIVTEEASGMYTTTIDLTYKNDGKRLLLVQLSRIKDARGIHGESFKRFAAMLLSTKVQSHHKEGKPLLPHKGIHG